MIALSFCDQKTKAWLWTLLSVHGSKCRKNLNFLCSFTSPNQRLRPIFKTQHLPSFYPRFGLLDPTEAPIIPRAIHIKYHDNGTYEWFSKVGPKGEKVIKNNNMRTQVQRTLGIRVLQNSLSPCKCSNALKRSRWYYFKFAPFAKMHLFLVFI